MRALKPGEFQNGYSTKKIEILQSSYKIDQSLEFRFSYYVRAETSQVSKRL